VDAKLKEPGLAPALYERLAGPAWQQVPETIRQAHLQTGRLQVRGVFRVSHGQGQTVRWLAWLLQLPPAAEVVPVQLHITPFGQGEKWVRTFGEKCLVTWQYERPGDLLAEKFGPLELRFQLLLQPDCLGYAQRAAVLSLGWLQLPVPAWLAPQVRASEAVVSGTDRSYVSVTISLPLLGLLISYEGELAAEERLA
jgi:hypothetical protein